jgi:predicted acyl esterase
MYVMPYDVMLCYVVYYTATDIMVAMRDGVKLSGDLYIPAIDGRVDPHRRWPCVLVRTPYNKSSVNPDFRNPGIYWTQNG